MIIDWGVGVVAVAVGAVVVDNNVAVCNVTSFQCTFHCENY